MAAPAEAASRQMQSDSGENLQLLDRDYSWPKCIFMVTGLSLCITVDILQYSMPLAFLPSVLEDRGHRPMVIATAIGIYYWTGFAGGAVITSYQIRQLFKAPDPRDEWITVQKTSTRIKYLIIGLLFGTITLMAQAYHPHCQMHTGCRFVQGAAGAFIFFYGFLLSAELFSGPQQIFAMTSAATALNIAEVLGSTLGANIYDAYGQSMVFFFLGAASIVNQVFLVAMLFMLYPADEPLPLLPENPPIIPDEQLKADGWKKLTHMLKSKVLGVAVVLIVSAALIKASVEEILPFHADHRWGMGPLEIGNLFSVIAIAYIAAAVVAGRVWESLGHFQVAWSGVWMILLGVCAWGVFLLAGHFKDQGALKCGLACYGVCLGMTHTPAALFLADAIEQEEGKCKDAANGIWNTMWEAGGSLGFLLGGILAEDYEHQVQLMGAYAIFSFVSAAIMLTIMACPKRSESSGKLERLLAAKKLGEGYGATQALESGKGS